VRIFFRLLGCRGRPPKHPSTQFRYDVLKEKYGNEDGSITIDRTEPVKAEEIVPAVNGLKVNGVKV
jgi:hypothetical protein